VTLRWSGALEEGGAIFQPEVEALVVLGDESRGGRLG